MGPEDQYDKALITRLVSGLAADTGERFFLSLVEQLCCALGADYAMIGKLVPQDEAVVQTLAVYAHDHHEANFTYALRGTPCEQVLDNKICVYTRGVQALFPEDLLLVDLAAEGYAGFPLIDSRGRVLGIFSVLFSVEIPDPLLTEQLLKLFSVRCGNELERLKNEAECQEREVHFQQLFLNSPVIYQSLDGDCCFLDVNSVWTETFGYRCEEVQGTQFMSYLTPESKKRAQVQFPTLKKNGQVRNVELEMLTRDGKRVQVFLNGNASYDSDENFLRTHCVLHNVTKLKNTELKLRHNEQKFRKISQQFEALLKGITDRIVLLDKQFRILWTNDHSGAGAAKKEKLCCYEFWYNRSSPCQGCPVVEVFSSEQPEVQQVEMPDGQSWNLRAFPVFDDEASALQVLMLAQNVTENILHQEHRIRVGQLAAIGELAAGVAHEINNPITGVINYAQLILNRAETGSEASELAGRIIREGDRIAEIVGHLLGLSRYEQQPMPVDIAAVLAETLALIGTQIYKEGIALNVTLADDLPKFEGYEQQLRQLFLNILSNARFALNKRFTEDNPNKRIDVALSSVGAGDTHLKISFCDYGVGIPQGIVAKIMQPFFTTKPSSEGTGLGLSISHEIVKKHDGEIKIESCEGQFTKIDILLPLTKKECANG